MSTNPKFSKHGLMATYGKHKNSMKSLIQTQNKIKDLENNSYMNKNPENTHNQAGKNISNDARL